MVLTEDSFILLLLTSLLPSEFQHPVTWLCEEGEGERQRMHPCTCLRVCLYAFVCLHVFVYEYLHTCVLTTSTLNSDMNLEEAVC